VTTPRQRDMLARTPSSKKTAGDTRIHYTERIHILLSPAHDKGAVWCRESMSSTDSYRPLQDGLRSTGRYLDENALRLIGLLTVDGGIVVTLAPEDIHKAATAVMLVHDDLRSLFTQARTARGEGNAPRSPDPLFPTAYEDFLRALGAAAAQGGWTELRLVRLGDIAIVRYGTRAERKEMTLTAQDVENILNHAFSQRR